MLARAALGYYFDGGGKDNIDALALLRAYLKRELRDARAWLGVVKVQMRAAVPEEYDGLGPEPAALATLDGDVQELVRVSQSAQELDEIARYFALRKNSVTGLGFARRALAADPGCVSCLDTLALLLFHAGRTEDALATQERVVNMMGEEEVSAGMRRRLERYRSAAGKGGEALREETSE